jgi:dTDP-4-dehydrorhamnose reductase
MTDDAPLELWGGIECTVNRVGDTYFDQVRKSGHHVRHEDVASFATIGFRAMRYPVLWERVAPDGLARADWAWTDERLALLSAANIRPIATLLHHGSGPRCTNLLDSAFPEKFAEYAAAVAARYPWLQDYTPINEPLTTARFSALYGHWYPHHRDDRSFVTALLHQLRATVRAMACIRRVAPGARLIQTEDAGRTDSTPALAHQADFENHRRWLTYDVLTGRVSHQHPLWTWLLGCGASLGDLHWFLDHPCPPDVVGLNYYLTSDRYLDERLARYPVSSHGTNGRERYADVDAVRRPGYAPRHHRILEEAWQRYGMSVALTEVHAGCTREDQLRWFESAWRGASAARSRGIDVRAVTMWSLLGAFDWNSLVVQDRNVYEVGAFDVRSAPPRRTALATLAAALAAGKTSDPLARQPGWWQRGVQHTEAARFSAGCGGGSANRPILIAGGTGTLGAALARAGELRGLRTLAIGRDQLDITSPEAILQALQRWSPWAIINAAGYVRVDDAESHRDACWRLNTTGALQLAAAAAAFRAHYVTISTDLVFDGLETRPYLESDATKPLNVYGASKSAAEEWILALFPDTLIVRTAALFDPVNQHGFLTRALREVSAGREVIAAEDIVISPTYVPHLAEALLDLLIDRERGIWHLANRGKVSWAGFARLAAGIAGLDESLVRGVGTAELGLKAQRPPFTPLDSERGKIMPELESGVADYLASPTTRWRERRLNPRVVVRGSN